jgi:hypothetical protein
MSTITSSQIKLLHIAPKQLGMDNDAFRAILKDLTGKESRKDLTSGQAGRVIDRLIEHYGFVIRGAKKSSQPHRRGIPRATPKVICMATPQELDKIEALIPLIEWRAENGYQSWLEKRMHITRVKTAEESYKTIEGLKKMFEGQQKRKYGKDWWIMAFSDAGVLSYIREHCPAEYK